MSNEELINALRLYAEESPESKLLNDAADALEAAEKRIAIVEEERDLERFAAKNYLERIYDLKAQLPKEGEWIKFDNSTVCSNCGFALEDWIQGIFYNFCPNCGSRMRKGEQNE